MKLLICDEACSNRSDATRTEPRSALWIVGKERPRQELLTAIMGPELSDTLLPSVRGTLDLIDLDQ